MSAGRKTSELMFVMNRDRRGATMVTVVILLPVLFALAAIAVNLAYIQCVNTKLQIVTDAATRAAGWEYVKTGDEAASLAIAQQLADLNPVEATVMSITADDLKFGVATRSSNDSAYTFTESAGGNGNAVRLTTNAFANGSGDALKPFFPVFGTTFDIRPVSNASYAQTTLDVAVIVDKSGSMAFAADEASGGTPAAAPDGWEYGDPVPPNSRWLDLVNAVEGFCAVLTETAKIENVALVGYANTSIIHVDLTDDYRVIMDQLDAISQNFEGGGTAAGDGLRDAINAVTDARFARPWANNALILMSDGDYNRGSDPYAAANDAAGQGIPVFTVTFGTGADQTMMQDIARITGGAHYHANDAAQLNEVFRNIAKRLPSMLTE